MTGVQTCALPISSNNATLVMFHKLCCLAICIIIDGTTTIIIDLIILFRNLQCITNVRQYQSDVKNQYVNWAKPQTTGNREEVRWTALSNSKGNGAIFIGTDHLATSTLPWSELEMTLAPHTYQLPKSSGTHLHLNAAVTGLGGNSCGQGPPLEQDRVKATAHSMGFIIRPIHQHDFDAKAHVVASGETPIAISRSTTGEVAIHSRAHDATLYYAVGKGKAAVYKQPFNLREGGLVTAWSKENEKFQVSFEFPKIESIPMQVVFAS